MSASLSVDLDRANGYSGDSRERFDRAVTLAFVVVARPLSVVADRGFAHLNLLVSSGQLPSLLHPTSFPTPSSLPHTCTSSSAGSCKACTDNKAISSAHWHVREPGKKQVEVGKKPVNWARIGVVGGHWEFGKMYMEEKTLGPKGKDVTTKEEIAVDGMYLSIQYCPYFREGAPGNPRPKPGRGEAYDPATHSALCEALEQLRVIRNNAVGHAKGDDASPASVSQTLLDQLAQVVMDTLGHLELLVGRLQGMGMPQTAVDECRAIINEARGFVDPVKNGDLRRSDKVVLGKYCEYLDLAKKDITNVVGGYAGKVDVALQAISAFEVSAENALKVLQASVDGVQSGVNEVKTSLAGVDAKVDALASAISTLKPPSVARDPPAEAFAGMRTGMGELEEAYRAEYVPGCRSADIARVVDTCKGGGVRPLHWVTGSHGAGKTHVMVQARGALEADKVVTAAHYFRVFGQLAGVGAQAVLHVAAQLSERLAGFPAAKGTPDSLSEKDLQGMWAHHVGEPLRKWRLSSKDGPWVVVFFDALDECGDSDHSVGALLEAVRSTASADKKMRVVLSLATGTPMTPWSRYSLTEFSDRDVTVLDVTGDAASVLARHTLKSVASELGDGAWEKTLVAEMDAVVQAVVERAEGNLLLGDYAARSVGVMDSSEWADVAAGRLKIADVVLKLPRDLRPMLQHYVSRVLCRDGTVMPGAVELLRVLATVGVPGEKLPVKHLDAVLRVAIGKSADDQVVRGAFDGFKTLYELDGRPVFVRVYRAVMEWLAGEAVELSNGGKAALEVAATDRSSRGVASLRELSSALSDISTTRAQLLKSVGLFVTERYRAGSDEVLGLATAVYSFLLQLPRRVDDLVCFVEAGMAPCMLLDPYVFLEVMDLVSRSSTPSRKAIDFSRKHLHKVAGGVRTEGEMRVFFHDVVRCVRGFPRDSRKGELADLVFSTLTGHVLGKAVVDVVLWNFLVSIHGDLGNVARAGEVVREMRAAGHEPNVVTYNSLLNVWVQQGRADKAGEVVKEMRAAGHEPDVVTYTSLLNMWVQQGKADKAGEVVKEMREAGHPPNVVTYSSLINLWAKSPTPWRFREVLDEMVRAGIRPDVFSFSPLIARFARDKDMASIRKIFDGMAHHGVQANLFSYNGALQCAASLNDRQAGTAILKLMTSRDKFTTDQCSFFRPPLDCSHLPLQQQPEHRRK